MHFLLGGRPNVNPRGTADFGIDDDEFITHGSDDEEDQSTSPSLPAPPIVILTDGPALVVDREPTRTEELYEEDIIGLARRTLAEDLEREAAEMEEVKLCQKSDYKKELIANRDKWKSLELDDKKQARIDAARQLAK
ncbi:unnamed protein product [Calypogeia fissa]